VSLYASLAEPGLRCRGIGPFSRQPCSFSAVLVRLLFFTFSPLFFCIVPIIILPVSSFFFFFFLGGFEIFFTRWAPLSLKSERFSFFACFCSIPPPWILQPAAVGDPMVEEFVLTCSDNGPFLQNLAAPLSAQTRKTLISNASASPLLMN